ncbi:hypothetical protein L249_0697, partial [Ophiocordyceps polyrhachis-furcata BCC 54312]
LSSCRCQQAGASRGKKERENISRISRLSTIPNVHLTLRASKKRKLIDDHRAARFIGRRGLAQGKPGTKSFFLSRVSTSSMAMDIDCSRRNRTPRPLSDAERSRLDEFIDSIHYSARYSDNVYEYRHVQLPKAMLKAIPKEYHDTSKGTLKLLWEDEWRALGITQSLGWEHYEVHEPEPHILLFKRPLNYQAPQ